MRSMTGWSRHFLAALAFAAAPAVLAQAWPAKPVRVLVNFAPGGALDLITRPLGAKLSESLGQPLVVENRAGAHGAIGLEAVARSAPDGYTLLSSAGSPLVINPHLYKYKLPVDPAKDIVPVAPTARVSVFLVVRPALNDLLGGQIDFMFDPGPAVPQVRADKLRLLGIATATLLRPSACLSLPVTRCSPISTSEILPSLRSCSNSL